MSVSLQPVTSSASPESSQSPFPGIAAPAAVAARLVGATGLVFADQFWATLNALLASYHPVLALPPEGWRAAVAVGVLWLSGEMIRRLRARELAAYEAGRRDAWTEVMTACHRQESDEPHRSTGDAARG